jgi:hypothetical protein
VVEVEVTAHVTDLTGGADDHLLADVRTRRGGRHRQIAAGNRCQQRENHYHDSTLV